MPTARLSVLLSLSLLALPTALALPPPTLTNSQLQYAGVLDKPRFPALFEPSKLAGDLLAGGVGKEFVECKLLAQAGQERVAGVKVNVDGVIRDMQDDIIMEFNRNLKSDESGYGFFRFNLPLDGEQWVNFHAIIDPIKGDKIDRYSVDCGITSRKNRPCTEDDLTLCLLNDERFRVEVDWFTSSDSGSGMVLTSNPDSGEFYFLNPTSADLIVQLLNACSANDHFWVFYAATTNVEFEMTVTDTFTGQSRAYDNLQTTEPILDTAAFATCP